MVSTKEKKIIEETECKNRKKKSAFTPNWKIAAIMMVGLQFITAFMLVISVFNQSIIRDRIDMLQGNSEEVLLCVLSKPVDQRDMTTLQECKDKVKEDDS